MSLTKAQFERYHDAISRIDSATAADLEKAIRRAWQSSGHKDRGTLNKIAVEIAKDLADKYGLEASAVSAALFEDIYYNDTGARIEALLPNMEDYYYEYFGDAAEQMVENYLDADKLEEALRFLTGITVKAVHEWAHQTQFSNGRRVRSKNLEGADKVKWARIPTGAETCAFCLMLAGRGFVYESELSAGGGPEHSTAFDSFHPFCVVGDTRVSGPAILDGLARNFSGSLVQLFTASGRELTVTPEHPILTSDGWVVAGELTEGVDVVCTRGSNRHVVSVPDEKDVPPKIEDVVSSLLVRESFARGCMPATAENFNGKVSNSEVNVVYLDCLLSDVSESKLVENIRDCLLASRHDVCAGCFLFNGQCPFDFCFDGHCLSTSSVMGFCRPCRSLFLSHSGCAHNTGGASSPGFDSSFFEPSVNNSSADTSTIRDGQDALSTYVRIGNPVGHSDASLALMLASAGFNTSFFDVLVNSARAYSGSLDNVFEGDAAGIELDRIVCKKTIDSWVGHVYDLHTVSGWYSANGIITHNCDCLIVSSFDDNPVLDGYDHEVYERMYSSSRAFDDQGRVDLSATLHNMRQAYGLR